jgi:hypothetical protein
MKQQVAMKLTCNKCGNKAVGLVGHIGKRHQACGGRKPGSGTSRKDCGTWGGK